MALWFKHWNWPYPLRVKTTYKPWPIPYKKYSKGNLYLVYQQLPSPRSRNENEPFGEAMVRGFEEGLSYMNYEGAFFKFCFVDFPVKTKEEQQQRLADLQKTVVEIYKICSENNTKLIIGNALPLPSPNEYTLNLQQEYNHWLEEFAMSRENILIFDLYTPLTDEKGRFKMNLARASDDHHPGEKAFAMLDKSLFPQVEEWIMQQ